MTILLAKVLGLFMIIASVIMIARHHWIMGFVEEFGRDRPVRFVTAVLELLGGLFIVLGFGGDGSAAAAVILVIGWLMVVEGIAYLALPDTMIRSVFAVFNRPAFYFAGGLLALAFGTYLALYGFRWIG